MKFRRRRAGAAREDVFINLASLIDVIFVLLLFFVVSTTFTRPEQLNIELPSAESGETAGTEQKQLELSVDAEGHYALNGQALAKSDLATLMAAMQRESAGDNNLPVVISADAKSTHQSVSRRWTQRASWASSTCASPRSRTRRPSPDVVLRATARRLVPGASGAGAAASAGGSLSSGGERPPGGLPVRAQARLPGTLPVLVVGNITVGGTGKTPMILWMIEHCRARGLRVGVISRGYGARPPTTPWRVRAEQDAAEAGDEPLMIVRRSGVPLMIDPDRPRALQALLAEEQLDLVLCDDGLQHYRLARDLELVLIDAARGLGNGRCLPAGPLREPAERLESVDALLYNGADEDPDGGYAFRLQPTALINLQSGERRPLEHFPAGQEVHALAGIGNPQRFFRTLEALHWRAIPHAFPDHATYTAAELAFSPPLPLLMTEKDAVKCRAFAAADWWYLAVDAVPSPAFVAWFDARLEHLLAR